MHSVLTLLLVFTFAAAVVWKAGVWLSDTTDILATNLHFGQALGGLVLLAVATNLPEIAITTVAALHHDLGLATGNILGGIAIQTVVLTLVDRFGTRTGKPLTARPKSLVPALEACVTVAVLVVAVMGTQMPSTVKVWRFTPEDVALLLLWLGGVHLSGNAKSGMAWNVADGGPGQTQAQKGGTQKKSGKTGPTLALFALAALLTLAAGYALETTGDALAKHFHLTGALFGATVLAAATSLPELSTGLAAAKLGDYELVLSDIFGGNAFLPVLFLLATLVSGTPALPQAARTDIYLAGLGILLTAFYLIGLLLRSDKKTLGMGRDSLWVLAMYALGMAGLAALGTGGK